MTSGSWLCHLLLPSLNIRQLGTSIQNISPGWSWQDLDSVTNIPSNWHPNRCSQKLPAVVLVTNFCDYLCNLMVVGDIMNWKWWQYGDICFRGLNIPILSPTYFMFKIRRQHLHRAENLTSIWFVSIFK